MTTSKREERRCPSIKIGSSTRRFISRLHLLRRVLSSIVHDLNRSVSQFVDVLCPDPKLRWSLNDRCATGVIPYRSTSNTSYAAKQPCTGNSIFPASRSARLDLPRYLRPTFLSSFALWAPPEKSRAPFMLLRLHQLSTNNKSIASRCMYSPFHPDTFQARKYLSTCSSSVRCSQPIETDVFTKHCTLLAVQNVTYPTKYSRISVWIQPTSSLSNLRRGDGWSRSRRSWTYWD